MGDRSDVDSLSLLHKIRPIDIVSIISFRQTISHEASNKLKNQCAHPRSVFTWFSFRSLCCNCHSNTLNIIAKGMQGVGAVCITLSILNYFSRYTDFLSRHHVIRRWVRIRSSSAYHKQNERLVILFFQYTFAEEMKRSVDLESNRDPYPVYNKIWVSKR